MTEHKATPERWAEIERFASETLYGACIIELRSRVEALEAAAKPVESNYSDEPVALFESADDRQRWMERQLEKPDSSLVERVVDAITDVYAAYGTADETDARAAIFAVADWFEQQGSHTTAAILRMEAQ